MLNGHKENETGITRFILLGLGNNTELWPFLFLFFLVIYLVTIIGNLLIIVLVANDQQLHTPMYFFLGNLSCLETFYSSTILPKMLSNLLTGDRTITVSGCLSQYYFFGCCLATETFLLAAMSYDRYLAICRPLLYASVMNRNLCFQLISGAWLNGLMVNSIIVFLIAQFSFCGPNVIDHYFCDLSPLEKLTCSDPGLLKIIVFLLTFIFTLAPFFLTVSSYVCIIASIIRIQSTTGRQKVFSTCSSHLMVVCLFYGTIIIVYMLPDTPTLGQLNKIFSIFYTILTPLANPLIYTLRNKEIHKAFRRIHGKLSTFFGRSCLKTFLLLY
ncbi:olfactory receptor 6B1-like [Protobothrops mucrosquamatus]|uniref:olfactory receptor 6B1-like n=1 Tax=Protobothrops mucrosquamatus TaxID=103944 RepID=UPI000775D783|nr:olfactory receptor 6B1-like [Protobothrops mucrosquamatus]